MELSTKKVYLSEQHAAPFCIPYNIGDAKRTLKISYSAESSTDVAPSGNLTDS